MKWVALTTLVVLVLYTFLTLHYRKTGKSFEPHHDIKDRANTLRLLSAGFQRVTLDAQRPAETLQLPSRAEISSAIGGLPSSLGNNLVDQPLLPSDIVSVTAAPQANALMSYPVEFTCALPDHKRQLGGAQLYVRDDEMVVIPSFEHLSGELLSRTRENLIRVTIPAGVLKPGHYQVTLVGAKASKTWSLEVR
jgi:hypothetical protein